MPLTNNQKQSNMITDDNREEYKKILKRLEEIVINLERMETPDALESIDPKTIANIERIKAMLKEDEEQHGKATI